MKTYLVLFFTFLLIAALSLFAAAFADNKNVTVSPKIIEDAALYNVACGTGSTTCEAIAAVADIQHRILKIGVSLDAEDNITFKCGSTTKLGPIFFAANSGLVDLWMDVDITCATNEAFNYIKGAAATPTTAFGVSRQQEP